jgi:uncharacterized protein (TIGR03437 family)
MLLRFTLLLVTLLAVSPARSRVARYTLILEEPPLASLEGKEAARTAVADHEKKLAAAHLNVRAALENRQIHILGESQLLVNAIYVAVEPDQVEQLRTLPGVIRVVEMEPIRRQMVRAVDLVRVPEAWRALNGETNAGTGVKIAVLDSGIDHRHPAFQDPSLPMPAGYPRCRQADCSFTNSKVIVARSYVDLLELSDRPIDSRPDDRSPRDRVGHGTATAMVAAGVRHQSPLGAISGIAPRAHLGNYKIFGSPFVNDVTFDNVVIQALEDAINDGMEIAVLAIGSPAEWQPEDRGGTCNRSGNLPCDVRTDAVENAIRRGLTVVASGGNRGDSGTNLQIPSMNSITSPATAPSALTVGATTNGQRYFQSVRSTGNVPAELREIRALFGDGPRVYPNLRGPLRDLAAMQDEGKACSPLANGSLAGVIALIQRGDCAFSVKVNNAQRAGAIGAVIQQREPSNAIFSITGLAETGIPAVMIGSSAGRALQQSLAAGAVEVTLDPTLFPAPWDPNFVALFSSYGPSIGGGVIKPEIAAVGDPLYMATQNFDPNGDMFSPDGYYTVASGTSFSAPMVAGAAALFKQRLGNTTPAQVKSAVVNTAAADVLDEDFNGRTFRAKVTAVGAGKLDASGVARTNVTIEPATVSFGYLTNTNPVPLSRGLRFNNHSNATLNLRLEVQAITPDRNARIVLSDTNFSLGAGQSRQVTVRLEGSNPVPGAYDGEIIVNGGAVPLRIPYLYLRGDGVAVNAIPVRGSSFVLDTNRSLRISFKLVDQFGVPVADAPVRFRATVGGGSVDTASARTDILGIAEARVILGSQIGLQEFTAESAGQTIFFSGRARLTPTIATDGVVNAASNQVGRGVAPGSYIAIYGRGLSDAFKAATTASLPLALAGVSVSFDVPERRLSLPGRLHFVSDGQVNVQVPWELQGLNSAQMKVSIGDSQSDLYTVPLNDFSPAMFEVPDPSGRIIAAALDENFRLVTTQNPWRRGQLGQLYCNGLGPVTATPSSGEPTPAEPLATTRVTATVTVGGRPAEVLFSGLAPFNVGLYQLNLRLAPDTPTGVQPVVITVNGVSSKTVNLPVQ